MCLKKADYLLKCHLFQLLTKISLLSHLFAAIEPSDSHIAFRSREDRIFSRQQSLKERAGRDIFSTGLW
jgi:hypothetical protein